MPNYNEILQDSERNVKALSGKLKQLDELHDRINELLKQPAAFEVQLKEIEKMSQGYTSLLADVTEKYLDRNNALLVEKLQELANRNNDLGKEVSRLHNTDLEAQFQDLQKVFIDQTRADLGTEYKKIDGQTQQLHLRIVDLKQEVDRLLNTDFVRLFQSLQTAFIEQTRKDLAVELAKFDDKTQGLQKKIDELKSQIDRLEKIDLEKHFASLQKTLSEIFGAVNSINITLSSLTQTLTGIVQSLGGIQSAINANHEKITAAINSNQENLTATIKLFEAKVEARFSSQDEEAKKHALTIEQRVKDLAEQNNLLKKEIKINRIMQIVGLSVITLILTYLAFRHN